MKDTKQLRDALIATQAMVIGLFHPKFYQGNEFIPVIENDNGVLTCLEVHTLLGYSILMIGIREGKYIAFPCKYKIPNNMSKEGYRAGVDDEEVQITLLEMKEDVMKFDKWYKENVHL